MKIHPRIYKEARPLLWPLCAVLLLMACVMLVWREAVLGLLVYWLGGAFLAAGSFGEEFQSRTLPMLLTQPVSRSRLWAEKMLVLVVNLGVAVGCLVGMSHDLARAIEGPVGYMILPLLCSAGFWTLFARSTIGGMAFSLAALAAMMMTVTFAVGKIWEGQPFMVEGLTPLAMSQAGIAYSALFLWLGWWKFSRLELNTSDGGESGLGAGVGKAVPTVAVLRCGPGSPVANLARKELRLQLPLLGFALLFALFWLALAWLMTAVPSQRDGAEMLLQVGTVAYMALALTLAGCLPLCEERSLGLHLANLTLPVAVGTQWRIKLLVALAVGLAAGVALPVLLSEVTAPAIVSPLRNFLGSWDTVSLGLALLSLMVLLGFWGATMVGRVTHVVLVTALTVAGFFAAIHLAIRSVGGSVSSNFMVTNLRVEAGSYSLAYYGRGVWQADPPEWFVQLTAWVAARWQLSADGFGRLLRGDAQVSFIFWPLIGVATLVAAIQAWRAFRIAAPKWGRTLGWMIAAVAAVAALQTVCLRLVETARWSMPRTSLVVETQAAFNAIKLPPPSAVAARWVWTDVTLADLEATGKLSAQTKHWLRNTTLRFRAFRGKITPVERGRGSIPVDPALTDEVRYIAVVFFSGDDWQFFNLSREFLPP